MALTYNPTRQKLTHTGNTHTTIDSWYQEDVLQGWGVITNPTTGVYVFNVKKIDSEEGSTLNETGIGSKATTIIFQNKSLAHNTKFWEIFNNNNGTSITFENCNFISQEEGATASSRVWLFYIYEGGLTLKNIKLSCYTGGTTGKADFNFYAAVRTGDIQESQFTGTDPGKCAIRNTVFDNVGGIDVTTEINGVQQASFDNVTFTGCQDDYLFSVYLSYTSGLAKTEPSGLKEFDNSGYTFGVRQNVESGGTDAKFIDCDFEHWTISDETFSGTPIGILECYTFYPIIQDSNENPVDGTIEITDGLGSIVYTGTITSGRITSQTLTANRYYYSSGNTLSTSYNPYFVKITVSGTQWTFYFHLNQSMEDNYIILFPTQVVVGGGERVSVITSAGKDVFVKPNEAKSKTKVDDRKVIGVPLTSSVKIKESGFRVNVK